MAGVDFASALVGLISENAGPRGENLAEFKNLFQGFPTPILHQGNLYEVSLLIVEGLRLKVAVVEQPENTNRPSVLVSSRLQEILRLPNV
jgi:hypothetical protein